MPYDQIQGQGHKFFRVRNCEPRNLGDFSVVSHRISQTSPQSLVEYVCRKLWALMIDDDDDDACDYVAVELAANLDRQLERQPAGASRQELEENKMQMEKSKNSFVFENMKERNVFQFHSSSSYYYYHYYLHSTDDITKLFSISCHLFFFLATFLSHSH